MPMAAMPAPMYFAATGSIRKLLFEVGWLILRLNG
jgi:hypothetical protein